MVSDDKKETVSPISDNTLDDLLSQWAEAEIEPPAGFHAKTMERLRYAQQEKESAVRSGKVVPFFLQNKKWMSAAAAAVLVLFCIPVVQAQFAGNSTNSIYEPPAEQTQPVTDSETDAENANTSGKEASAKSEDNQASGNADIKQHQKEQITSKGNQTTHNKNIDENKNEVNQNDDKTQAAVSDNQSALQNAGTENPVTGKPADQSAVPQTPNAQAPAAVYFSMDDTGANMTVGGENQAPMQSRRSVEGSAEQNAADISSYQSSLEELELKMQKLQETLEENNAALEKNPKDKELIDKIDEQQKEIDLLKKEIEQLKNLVAEAEEASKSE